MGGHDTPNPAEVICKAALTLRGQRRPCRTLCQVGPSDKVMRETDWPSGVVLDFPGCPIRDRFV
jgi:hypothetical protein